MAKVMVVDDDPIVGDLTRYLLIEAGHEAVLIDDSREAIAAVKREKPAAVLLDILMPGIDGLMLCRQLRQDPETNAIKIAMVSAKATDADKEKAEGVGADAFIRKPYKVALFASQIQALLSGTDVPENEVAPLPPPAPAGFSEAPDAKLEVKIWGFRSLSAPASGRRSRYGHRTSCVSVQAGDRLFVFDAGGGIVPLGKELLERGSHKDLWIFISHFHQDHVEGLGAFQPARAESFNINLCGASDVEKSLQDMAREAFERTLPDAEPVKARIELFELQEETYEMLPGVSITPFYANHPSTTLGFILETEGRKLVYCPDSEVYGESASALQDYDDRLARLCHGADILIHDARYTDGDYQSRKNSGHSSFVNTLILAARAEAKRLVLFHLEDTYADQILDDIEAQAKALAAEKGLRIECAVAREGLTLKI